MATGWAGAEAAGAMSDSLEKMLAQRFLERKQVEVERAQRAQEAQQQALMQQRAEEVRAAQAQRMTEFVGNRDENYQQRLERRAEVEAAGAQHTADQTLRSDERAKDATAHWIEHADAQRQHEGDRTFTATENEKGRALQRYLASGREPASASVHWDKDADGNPRAYRVGKDGAVTPVDLPGAAPAGPSKDDKFRADLDTFSTNVYNHPGLSSAGAGFNLGRSYNTDFGNLKGAQKQLVNMYLSDPDVRAKIAAMKPATDADVQRALAQAVNIDVETMDAPAIKAEIDRLRTKGGLKPLGGAQAVDGTVAMTAPDGRPMNVPAAMVAEAEKRGAKRN